jgi:hypothetical protein
VVKLAAPVSGEHKYKGPDLSDWGVDGDCCAIERRENMASLSVKVTVAVGMTI